MKLNAVGENSPYVQLNITGTLVFPSSDETADVAQIHWMMDDFVVQSHKLQRMKC